MDKDTRHKPLDRRNVGMGIRCYMVKSLKTKLRQSLLCVQRALESRASERTAVTVRRPLGDQAEHDRGQEADGVRAQTARPAWGNGCP